MMRILEWLANHFYLVFFLISGFVVLANIYKRQSHQKVANEYLNKAIKASMHEPLTLHPEVDPALCAGCGACTRVCPEGDILKMINHKPVLVSPAKCVGHGECERACPFDAITLVFGTKTRGMDIPRVTKNYETNLPGLYIAGELGGMGLIRNAIKQGHLAAQHAFKNLSPEPAQYDVFIVGAGPAGMAASLAAIAAKKTYLTIEQGGFGGTVFHFPRQKIVMSHPFDLPIVGKMKFNSNKVSKEELLDYWQQVRNKTGLKIKEQTQFTGLEKVGQIFKVKTNTGEFTARKVILATGVRGTPRRLGVPGEDKAKVTYNLLDPEQYQSQTVVVVGGGNAAVESAQMLADPRWKNTVHLLVRSADFDRCNEDNINRIRALEKKGRVQIWFNSSVNEIHDHEVVVKKNNDVVRLPNKFVFVFAGAELPHKFLMSLGVAIDKKHGEALAG